MAEQTEQFDILTEQGVSELAKEASKLEQMYRLAAQAKKMAGSLAAASRRLSAIGAETDEAESKLDSVKTNTRRWEKRAKEAEASAALADENLESTRRKQSQVVQQVVAASVPALREATRAATFASLVADAMFADAQAKQEETLTKMRAEEAELAQKIGGFKAELDAYLRRAQELTGAPVQ